MVMADCFEDKTFKLKSRGRFGGNHAEIRGKRISKLRKSCLEDSKVGSIIYVNVTDK